MVCIGAFCKVDKPLHAANNFDEFTSAISTYLIELVHESWSFSCVMFSVSVWSGNLPACFSASSRFEANKLQVFSKLNNKYLGLVDKPCAQTLRGSCYAALRKLQDQIAVLLRHECAPPKYLALYVGDVRLTKPDFPFVDQLDLEDQAKVVKALQSACVSAMYDTDVHNAEASLKARGLYVSVQRNCAGAYVQVEQTYATTRQEPVLVLPELGAWSIHQSVVSLQCGYTAHKLGDFSRFPYLRHLVMHSPGIVEEADLRSLAPCKWLRSLWLILGGSTRSLSGVGELVDLQELVIDFLAKQLSHVTTRCTIPTEIGKLTKLILMRIGGYNVAGRIPTEIGLLTRLETLHLFDTALSGVIPTELGLLSQLRNLSFLCCADLCGVVHLPSCSVSLRGTPNVRTIHI